MNETPPQSKDDRPSPPKPRVLCVDDEPNVAQAMAANLRKHFEVITATSGDEALARLTELGEVAVIVSDLRMPGMDGTTLLARVREASPATTRILLTGHADLDAAIAAVNDGQLFRFVTKPCPSPQLVRVIADAVSQHELVVSQRVLLEQTLLGSMRTVADLLALASPEVFGRATRIQSRAAKFAVHLGLPTKWELEIAAMFSQVGCVTLPQETLEKMNAGKALSDAENAMVDELPAVGARLLAHIPRLEAVRDILTHSGRARASNLPAKSVRPEALHRARGSEVPAPVSPLVARALRIVIDYDALQGQGLKPPEALATLRGRMGLYDPTLLESFSAMIGSAAASAEVRELALHALRPGMTLVDGIRTRAGVLLIARGQEVTVAMLERIRNFSLGLVREPVRVTGEDL